MYVLENIVFSPKITLYCLFFLCFLLFVLLYFLSTWTILAIQLLVHCSLYPILSFTINPFTVLSFIYSITLAKVLADFPCLSCLQLLLLLSTFPFLHSSFCAQKFQLSRFDSQCKLILCLIMSSLFCPTYAKHP